jgi:hypothetical protein
LTAKLAKMEQTQEAMQQKLSVMEQELGVMKQTKEVMEHIAAGTPCDVPKSLEAFLVLFGRESKEQQQADIRLQQARIDQQQADIRAQQARIAAPPVITSPAQLFAQGARLKFQPLLTMPRILSLKQHELRRNVVGLCGTKKIFPH